MQQQSIRILVACVTVLAVAVFSWTLVRAIAYVPDDVGYVAAPISAPSKSLPSRLIIPSLSINANVQEVGTKADGSMGTPNNFTDVAWYKYGIVPGQIGTAIIDGHVDNGLSLAGVFKHLSDIKVGDEVEVQQEDGSVIHFVVTEVDIYPYQNVPMASIMGRNDAAYLTLITCDGAWVGGGDTYNERLVVVTKMVAS